MFKIFFILQIFIPIALQIYIDPDINSLQGKDYFEEEENEESANIQVSYIEKSFNNRKSFTCPLIKNLVATGTNGGNLSPEDIDVVATMGDVLSTGIGLWPGTDVEFRGAVFTTGGDANIDGLVTFANILYVFNPKLQGTSNGMGSIDSLPLYQLNVAEAGAETDAMLKQANKLINRIRMIYPKKKLANYWILVFITIGTEELCSKCDKPNTDMLKRAILTLKKAIPNLFVVLIGPIYVASPSLLNYNVLKPRCPCLSKLTNIELRHLQRTWRQKFNDLEAEFAQRKYQTFVLLSIPLLTISSREPEQLFVPEKPFLNRRGHTYAAKWLWNRLIAGSKYNASNAPLSEDSYYCPSLGCPYFRTPDNRHNCVVMTKYEYDQIHATTPKNELQNTIEKPKIGGARAFIHDHYIVCIIGLTIFSSISVIGFGTIFFCHGINAKKGRFESLEGV